MDDNPVKTKNASRSNLPSLSHLELRPQLGGGYLVRHFYHGYRNEPKDVRFNKNGRRSLGGETIQAHLQKHAGLWLDDVKQAKEKRQWQKAKLALKTVSAKVRNRQK